MPNYVFNKYNSGNLIVMTKMMKFCKERISVRFMCVVRTSKHPRGRLKRREADLGLGLIELCR